VAHLLYLRCSGPAQSVEAQRQALMQDTTFDKEFIDEGVSCAVLAAWRPGFAALLEFAHEGDTVHVYAVDRLGRDAIDIQSTIKRLLAKGVSLNVRGLGLIAKGAGELIVAVIAQLAEMERERLRERTRHGRELAKASLVATGKTHRGKVSLGRRARADAAIVSAWHTENKASITTTAKHFNLTDSTVKRYCLVQSFSGRSPSKAL
jgi:putative DNA-invertase from lambdoid prophage Rac